MWFWWRGTSYIQTHIFCRFLLVSWKLLLVMRNRHYHEVFSAFLDMRRYKNWAHKISSWKYLTIWKPVLPFPFSPPPHSLSQHRVPHFFSSLWTPFRGCWKSAAPSACDLILVEVDSKRHFVADKTFYKISSALSYHSSIDLFSVIF